MKVVITVTASRPCGSWKKMNIVVYAVRPPESRWASTVMTASATWFAMT